MTEFIQMLLLCLPGCVGGGEGDIAKEGLIFMTLDEGDGLAPDGIAIVVVFAIYEEVLTAVFTLSVVGVEIKSGPFEYSVKFIKATARRHECAVFF